MAYSGPFAYGDRVQLTDAKRRHYTVILEEGGQFHSHKGIIIGKNGRKLKGIGKSAREEIEFLLDTKVNLQLWVKVKENWRNLTNFITDFGLNENRD